jgi:DNA polymerase
VNLQNLPSRDKNKKALKNALLAPLGHYIINCDSSQIEARVLAWLAGQDEVVSQFANGEDVYSIFATKIYNRPISKANPAERFVGKTCVLGLGYGTGAKKLQHTLATAQPINVSLPEDECKRIVDLYRQENDKIPELWRECDRALEHLASWPSGTEEYTLGQHEAVWVTPNGLRLPNGLYIKYPKLQRGEKGFIYTSRKGVQSLWGGAVVENVVQALARIIVGEQMLQMRDTYRPVLTVHDAAVCVAPTDKVQEAVEFIRQVMSTPPKWAPGLPVACEAKYGRSYGDC